MIREVILENGIYKGKTRLDEEKYMSRDYATQIAPEMKELYTIKNNVVVLTQTGEIVRKDDPNLFHYIQNGTKSLTKAITINPQYFVIVDKILKGSTVSDKEKKIALELLQFGTY